MNLSLLRSCLTFLFIVFFLQPLRASPFDYIVYQIGGPETFSLILLFLIFAFFLKFLFSRAFPGKRLLPLFLSFAISLLIVYYLDLRYFTFDALFSLIGFSDSFSFIILGLFLAVVIFILLKKKLFKPRYLLVLLGVLLIVYSVWTDWYNKGTAILIGFVLLCIGVIRIVQKQGKEEKPRPIELVLRK